MTERPPALPHDSPPDLDRLFRPHRIAVVGASDTPGRPNTNIWRRLTAWAAAKGAEVIPINPNRETVDGLRCLPSVSALDAPVDVVAVLVNEALPVVEDAVASDAGFVVVFAAGFAELGDAGRSEQDRLGTAVARSGTRLLGPNTNLNLFEDFRTDLDGKKIALITQSGHQGRPIFQAQDIGIGLNYWAPTGNEVDLEFADFATWFADQPDTGAIAAYIEGFKDGATLRRAADHALRRGVPIVCVKVGRTAAGASMAASHTGKMTGTDDVVSAVFRQHGVVRVDALDELLDVSQMFARHPIGPRKPAHAGVVVYSISGGTGAHMADMCAAAGLHLPTLSATVQDQLHEWIPSYLRVSNPVDNGGHPVGDERGRKILDVLVADPDVAVIICPITGAFPPMSDRLAHDLADVAETTDKPVCVVWGSPVGDEPAYRDILLGSPRLAVFRTFGGCVRAVREWVHWHRFASLYESPFASSPGTLTSLAESVELPTPGEIMNEHDSKAVLRAYGIATTAEAVVTSRSAAIATAVSLGQGGPVAMKGLSGGLAHKSDVGGVRLGVAGDETVGRTFDELAELSGGTVLVAELVSDGVAELIVGLSHDSLFGPVVMAGDGGIHAEVFSDVTFRAPPFGRAEAHRMLAELRCAAILRGVRGRPPGDVEAVVDVLCALQQLALDLGDRIAEIDINPLIVRPTGAGAVAADALVVAHRRSGTGNGATKHALHDGETRPQKAHRTVIPCR